MVPVTALDVLEPRIVPPLRPTKPPTMLFAPVLVTGPEDVEKIIKPGLAWVSAPMKPPPTPAKPPARLPAPTLTLPLACASAMRAVLKYGAPSAFMQLAQLRLLDDELDPTSPPALLPLPACTLPVAVDERIVPELSPTNPPACRLATFALPTFPLADESEIRP